SRRAPSLVHGALYIEDAERADDRRHAQDRAQQPQPEEDEVPALGERGRDGELAEETRQGWRPGQGQEGEREAGGAHRPHRAEATVTRPMTRPAPNGDAPRLMGSGPTWKGAMPARTASPPSRSSIGTASATVGARLASTSRMATRSALPVLAYRNASPISTRDVATPPTTRRRRPRSGRRSATITTAAAAASSSPAHSPTRSA